MPKSGEATGSSSFPIRVPPHDHAGGSLVSPRSGNHLKSTTRPPSITGVTAELRRRSLSECVRRRRRRDVVVWR
jgi:hypothetical protein